MDFLDTLKAVQQQQQSTLAIGLAPALDLMPAEYAKYDDPFLPFGKAVIDATHDLACAYVFHLGAYLAIGGAGAVALERTIAYLPRNLVKILHGPFATGDYARAAFDDAFDCTAVTLSPLTVTSEFLQPYAGKPAFGAFLNVETPGVDASSSIWQEFAGRLGTYKIVSNEQGHLEMGSTCLDWYWGPTLYSSRRLDFSERLRESAEALRKKPS